LCTTIIYQNNVPIFVIKQRTTTRLTSSAQLTETLASISITRTGQAAMETFRDVFNFFL
jgi:hypothetical protein